MEEGAKASRHEELQARFLLQQEERAQQRKLKARSEQESRAPAESVDRFWDHVRSTGEGIDDALDRLRTEAEAKKSDAESTQEAIVKLLAEVKGLQKRLADSTIFLPPYDVRRAQEEISNMAARIEETRAALAPRKKFSFTKKKTKKQEGGADENQSLAGCQAPPTQDRESRPSAPCCKPPSAAGPQAAAEGKEAAAEPPTASEREEDAMPGFTGRSSETLDLAGSLPSAPDGRAPRDILLRDLTNCTVTMCEALGFVRLEKLKDCRVYCGPVAGPIYVESCSGCTLVMASRQLRIHNTTATDFYVHVVSGPIIEDCKGVRFAPYCLSYPKLQAHFQANELEGTTNAWADVKDFKWLRAHKSPNWDIIPEAERTGPIKLGAVDDTSSPASGIEGDEDEL